VFKKDLELYRHWERVLDHLEKAVGKRPGGINSVLFLIGVRELDLIHSAIWKVMSLSGYYTLEGLDEDGWPHWKLVKKLPHVDMLDQEKLLKMHIIEYFENEIGLQ
jgi:hypothetical protein